MRYCFVLVAWAGAIVGCAGTQSDDLLECGAGGQCPTGYECRADNLCYKKGMVYTPDAPAVPKATTLNLAVIGNGTVTLTGLATCDQPSCSYLLTDGTELSLTAHVRAPSRFAMWSGSCAGTNATIALTIAEDTSCGALFVDRVTVSAGVAGATGSVSAHSNDPAADCHENSCVIDKGGSVTLTAPTIDGYHFDGWLGNCSGTTPTVSLGPVENGLTCTASYTPSAVLRVTGAVMGAVGSISASSPTNGANCAQDGCTVPIGGAVVLQAPALAGYRFTGWSGDRGCANATLQATYPNVTKSLSCIANYVQRFTVSGAIGDGATGAVVVSSTDLTATCTASSCTVDARGKTTLLAPSPAGYRFTGWSGGCAGTDNPLVLTNVTEDKSCTASYIHQVFVSGEVAGVPQGPHVAVISTVPGAVCTEAGCTLSAGQPVALTAPTVPGYRFNAWSGDAGCSGTAVVLMIAHVNANTTCTATYVKTAQVTGTAAGVPVNVTATSIDSHASCMGNSCTIDIPGAVTLTAPIIPSVAFKGWTGPSGCSVFSQSVTLTNVTTDVTCTAVYAQRVTVTASTPAEGGAVTLTSQDSSAQCDGTSCTLDAGGYVTLASTAPADLRFVGWNGAGCTNLGLNTPVDLQVQGNTTCVAQYVNFESTKQPVFMTRWLNPTGWIDAHDKPVTLTFQPVFGGVWECRTGRTATGSSHVDQQKYVPCDGATGTKPVYYGKPVDGAASGSYRTDVRFHILDYYSATASYGYYAHESLNRAEVCADAYSDAAIFSAAQQPIGNFVLNRVFAFSADTTDVAPPFLALTFILSQYNKWSVAGSPDPVPPTFNPIAIQTLRHRFTLDPENRLLLVRRQYESSRRKKYDGQTSCANTFEFGWRKIKPFSWAPRIAGNPHAKRLNCVGLVLNAQGHGVCVQANLDGTLFPALFTTTAWRKLLDNDTFSPKNRTGCTTPACGTYLPD